MGDDDHLEDHAFGVELQLNELVEQRARAEVQGDTRRVAELEAAITALQDDLVDTAEQLADPEHVEAEAEPPKPDPTFRDL